MTDQTPGRHPQGPRAGPRPLALHLGTALTTWLSSRAALPLLMNGSLPWKSALAQNAAALRASLDGAEPAAVDNALEREIRRRLDLYLTGLERYRHHPYRRTLADAPEVWREGTTVLRDYGGFASSARTRSAARARPVVMFIPSLVNRGYILDLAAGNSFLRWFAGQGFRPLLVDWDRPGEVERGFDLTDYVAGRLERALDAATALTGGPIGLAGYCMGGNLALALAQRRPRDVTALALLATPWDFHADRPEFARAIAASSQSLLRIASRLGELSTDTLQMLFYLLDPYLAPRKFMRYAAFDPGSPRDLAFVALEDWLNDGVPLAAKVAQECLQDWYGVNAPGRNQWRIAGEPIEPEKLDLPTLVMVPEQDRIVPPASAEALAQRIPHARRLQPSVGHIGMMVSGVAENAVWRPLAAWFAGADRGRETSAPHSRRRSSRTLPSQVQHSYNSPGQGKR